MFYISKARLVISNAVNLLTVLGGVLPGNGAYRLVRASLVAQLVKNSPTMRETWVRSLGWEDPLKLPGPLATATEARAPRACAPQ